MRLGKVGAGPHVHMEQQREEGSRRVNWCGSQFPLTGGPMGSILRTHVGLGDPVPASPITQTPWHDRAKDLGTCASTWPGLLASSSSTEGQLRAARVGMFASSQPPCQTCLPASPKRVPEAAARTGSDHRRAAPVTECH